MKKCKGCSGCKSKFYDEVIHCLVSALDYRDPYTKGHSGRVGDMVTVLAEMMQLDETMVELVHISGHLHDIGKIGIADQVLLKKGPLSEVEWQLMKTHPQMGADIVDKCNNLQEVSRVIAQHHERWDGKGYPKGLKGEEIHIAARMIALCDTIDAMSSNRPYRDHFNWSFIYEEMVSNMGKQFDPQFLQYVVPLLERWITISENEKYEIA